MNKKNAIIFYAISIIVGVSIFVYDDVISNRYLEEIAKEFPRLNQKESINLRIRKIHQFSPPFPSTLRTSQHISLVEFEDLHKYSIKTKIPDEPPYINNTIRKGMRIYKRSNSLNLYLIENKKDTIEFELNPQ